MRSTARLITLAAFAGAWLSACVTISQPDTSVNIKENEPYVVAEMDGRSWIGTGASEWIDYPGTASNPSGYGVLRITVTGALAGMGSSGMGELTFIVVPARPDSFPLAPEQDANTAHYFDFLNPYAIQAGYVKLTQAGKDRVDGEFACDFVSNIDESHPSKVIRFRKGKFSVRSAQKSP